MINWLIGIIYLGLMVAWVPASWPTSLLNVLIFALGTVVVASVLLGGRIRWLEAPRITPEVIVLAVMVVWGPLQVIARQSVYPFETWNSAVNWAALLVTYLLAKALLRDRTAQQRFLSVQLWGGSALVIVSVLLHFSSTDKVFWLFESRYWAFGPFIYKNQFAVLIELLLPIAFYRMVAARSTHDRAGRSKAGRKSGGRMAYIILFAALFACMVASLSRAGLLIATGEVLVLTGISWRSGKVSLTTLRNVGLPLLLLVAAFSAVVGLDAIWNRFQEQNPLDLRLQLAQSTEQMIKAKPLMGYGLGTWRTVYPQYATFDIARVANEAHNDWLQWAADGGIPFALLMLFFAGWVCRLAWSHLWGIGLPAVFIHCLVDYPTRLPALAALIFLFAGALTATGRKRRSSASKESGEYQILSVRTTSD